MSMQVSFLSEVMTAIRVQFDSASVCMVTPLMLSLKKGVAVSALVLLLKRMFPELKNCKIRVNV